jgi:site-specific DNA-methyltransferase (adenine-specific)
MSDASLPTNEFVEGDCLEAMQSFPDDSIHAVVTDPPYNLNFMQSVTNGWDDIGSPKEYQDFCEQWASECLRVLKPGGHMLAFSGTQTFHRLFTGVEDAGFEIRDSLLAWLHGEGFPKGSDISKHIDRYYGIEDDREVAGEHPSPATKSTTGRYHWNVNDTVKRTETEVTVPASDPAKAFGGWNTQLKPAHEPLCLARASLSESAIYRNVLEHGTGGLNIDATRIEHDTAKQTTERGERESNIYAQDDYTRTELDTNRTIRTPNQDGRYPANVLLDTEAARLLDEQTGFLGTGGQARSGDVEDSQLYGNGRQAGRPKYGHLNGGGASRFFYTSKASTAERTHNGSVNNDFPTVKPLDLIIWLVKLVSKEGWTVLDPFCGSGTTALACELEGREWIAIDADGDTLDLARERMDHIDDLPDEYLNETLC